MRRTNSEFLNDSLNSGWSPRFLAAITWLFALLAVLPRIARAAEALDEDKEACKKNLTALGEAIQAYRTDNKDVPDWLSDLIPKYLKNPNVLMCPVAKKTGQVSNLGMNDPKVSTSYTYQFSTARIPRSIYGGSTHTMKEWKKRQLELVGPKVPMIRCHHHSPILNLAFDGRIYESTGPWERELKEIDPQDLIPGRIFGKDAANAALTKLRSEIPQRDTNASANLIDLSSYYNAKLTEGWHRQGNETWNVNDLAWLPRGLQRFAGVDFDVRGLIQLSSQKMINPRYPSSVKGIKIGRKTPRLHFLHGAGWTAPEGTPVASFVVHFENGEKSQINWLYGIHVLDWVVTDSEPKDKKMSVLAWTGTSPATEGQMALRLYKTEWANPNPDQPVKTLDYLSGNADPAPFLIAITAE